MLSTINGIDFVLFITILGLITLVSIQADILKKVRLDLRVERIHTEMLEYKLEQLQPPF